MCVAFNNYKLDTFTTFDLFFSAYSNHNHSLWELYRKNGVLKKDLTRLRFANTFSELKIKNVGPDEMNTFYLNEMPKQKELNEGALDILNYLKNKRYLLFIITNGFKGVQNEKIETSGLKPFFEKIFISEEIKSPKPGRGIFEYSIKSANAKKRKSIMIGDEWEVDVFGAVNFGIDAVHFQNKIDFPLKKTENPFNNSCSIYKTGMLNNLQLIL